MAQAVLDGVDTWMDRKWRDKQRIWRQQSTAWRAKEIEFRQKQILFSQEEREFMETKLRWREEDMKQRRVNNSKYLWDRFSECNRRDVEEKSEQLRSMSWLSGLVASFTMTSPIEFNYSPQNVTTAKVTAYAIFAAIVPSLMTTCTMICIYLLGRILKMGKMFVAEDAQEDFMKQYHQFAESNETLQVPPIPRRTFERFWNLRCEKDWGNTFSLFFWGIGSFLVLLCTMSFIKFASANGIAISFSAIVGLFFIIWLGTHFRWEAYLRKTEPRSLSLASIHRPQEASVIKDNPTQSHVQLESRSCSFDTETSSHPSIVVHPI